MTNTEVATLAGHTGFVYCCAVFAEGRRAISGGWDDTLKVWDLETNTEVATLAGHDDSVICCTVFAEGRRAISGSADNTLKVWDLETSTMIATLTGHTNVVMCCSIFSACNDVFKECNLLLISTFLACGNSSQIKKVNNSSGGEGEGAGAGSGGSSAAYPTIKRAKVTTTVGDEHKEGSTTLMDDNEAIVDQQQQQQQYKSTNFRSVCCISGVTRLIYAYAREIDAGGLRAVSGSRDGTLKVWNLEHYIEMATIDNGNVTVLCCDVFADGTPRVLSGSGNNDLKVWH